MSGKKRRSKRVVTASPNVKQLIARGRVTDRLVHCICQNPYINMQVISSNIDEIVKKVRRQFGIICFLNDCFNCDPAIRPIQKLVLGDLDRLHVSSTTHPDYIDSEKILGANADRTEFEPMCAHMVPEIRPLWTNSTTAGHCPSILLQKTKKQHSWRIRSCGRVDSCRLRADVILD